MFTEILLRGNAFLYVITMLNKKKCCLMELKSFAQHTQEHIRIRGLEAKESSGARDGVVC